MDLQFFKSGFAKEILLICGKIGITGRLVNAVKHKGSGTDRVHGKAFRICFVCRRRNDKEIRAKVIHQASIGSRFGHNDCIVVDLLDSGCIGHKTRAVSSVHMIIIVFNDRVRVEIRSVTDNHFFNSNSIIFPALCKTGFRLAVSTIFDQCVEYGCHHHGVIGLCPVRIVGTDRRISGYNQCVFSCSESGDGKGQHHHTDKQK